MPSFPPSLTTESVDATHAVDARERPMAAGNASTPGGGDDRARTDDVLITLFQSGEERVFRQLVDRHRERIRNLVFSIMNDASLVDDLSQEVFVKAYEGLHAFRFQSTFYTWLYRIAVNRCRDEIRKRKIRRVLSLHRLMEVRDAELLRKTSVEIPDTETPELVTRALQTLPEKFRIAVVLKDIDGLAYEEIAEVMHCELGTVKSRIARGRALLRTRLAPVIDR